MTPSDTKPIIALTMGDPAGVGPELCVRALNDTTLSNEVTLVVIGDTEVLKAAAVKTDQSFSAPTMDVPDWSGASFQQPSVVNVGSITMGDFKPGTINARTGKAGYDYVNTAIDAALAGAVSAISTTPLNKEAMRMGGINFPGHTEIFASRTEASRSCMMQYSEEITCTFVTVHVGYHEVPNLLTKERIVEVMDLTHEGLERIRGSKPKMVVCGLNPHAGENGLFGNREEENIIQPAIDEGRAKGYDIEGPLPPDTAFLPWKRKATDAFICMYHDQGHIPVKALAFDCAVNTTLGLPIIRTSVDHGTALDIAWTGKADSGSLYCAIRLAAKMSQQ